jgi:hypothetical protein
MSLAASSRSKSRYVVADQNTSTFGKVSAENETVHAWAPVVS